MTRLALISVSDKRGIVEFAQGLLSHDYQILSTGGTAKLLKKNNIPVVEVGEYTGFPEMMEGRIKTLHPKIHGGILCRRDQQTHLQEAEQHGINLIDLVVVKSPGAVEIVSSNLEKIKETLAIKSS